MTRAFLSLVLIGVGHVASGCQTTPELSWPFPRVEARDEAEILRIVEERSRLPASAYAEITMSFQSEKRGGVADTVVQVLPGSVLRMTAIKDLVITTRPIFDIVVRANRFELHLWPWKKPAERHAGRIDELAGIHEALFAFAVLRERIFAPGRRLDGSERSVRISDERVLLEDRGEGGFDLSWVLDRDTLGVERVVIRSPGRSGAVIFDFTSYLEVDGTFIPSAFRVKGGEKGFRVEGVLEDIELDLDPSELDFELAPLRREKGGS